MLHHRFRSHRPQIELQAARQHSGRDFLRVGRGQYKLEVIGRLFKRFQHGVESRVRQHVHFVNHEDLETPDDWFVNRLFQKLGNFVHPAVGSRVQLGVIHEATGVDIQAGLAHAARLVGNTAQPISANTIKGLGQNARDGGFAHTPRSGEQIGMVQALRAKRIAKRPNNMRLTDHFREVSGSIFARKNKIGHFSILICEALPPVCPRPLQLRVTGLPAW